MASDTEDMFADQCIQAPDGSFVHMHVNPETNKIEELGPCDDPKHQIVHAAQNAVNTVKGQPQPEQSTIFPVE